MEKNREYICPKIEYVINTEPLMELELGIHSTTVDDEAAKRGMDFDDEADDGFGGSRNLWDD